MRTSTSSLISSQVPEFVRADYPTFVAFVEAYYEYLDENGVDLTTLRDLDTTLDDFIKYFKSELAVNMPANISVDDRFILENIKSHYLAKGSEASYKLLFRLLYNKNVQVGYPGTQMLRCSDGRWQQDVSIFLKVSTGTPDLIEGKLVDVVKKNASFKVLIDRRQYVEIEVDRVVQLSTDVYEVFIDRRFFGNIEVGDVIRYKTIFAATVVSTTSKISIVEGGTGFKAGQLFEIKNGAGVRSIVKVTRVNDLGKILACEFIKFGIGYDTDFTISISASQDYFSTSTPPLLSSVLVNGFNIAITETTNGNAEQGYINKSDYAYSYVGGIQQFYMDGSYSGTILGTFTTQAISQVVSSVSKDQAILKLELGALGNYPGYYTSNAGFLSDSVFIQDSRYYQAFSYVIKLDERLASYKTAVRTMVHPAGTALFGEYQIINNFNISAALQSLVRILALNLNDVTGMIDNGDIDIDGNGGLIKYIQKALTESVLMLEYPTFAVSKPLADSISTPTDVTTLLTGKALADSIDTPSETIVFDIGTKLADSINTPTDTPITFDFGKSLTESITVPEIVSLLTTKYLIENPAPQQEEGYLALNPYSEGNYFAVAPIIYDNDIHASWYENVVTYNTYSGVYGTTASNTRKMGMDRVQYFYGFFPVLSSTLSMDNDGSGLIFGEMFNQIDFSYN